MKKLTWTLLLLTFLAGFSWAQSSRKISAESVTESLYKGKVNRIRTELFFEFPEGKIITWSHEPEEVIYMSNPLGEAKIYYPAKNNLIVRNDPTFSSQNHHFFQFLNNEYYDLGLQKLGFKVIDSHDDYPAVVTTWQAPAKLMGQVNQIDLVHEDFIPIYAEYRNAKNEVTLKIYYSDFIPVFESVVPGRVTEIIFVAPGDSIIKRTSYSSIKSGSLANQKGFNYVIPQDAKMVH